MAKSKKAPKSKDPILPTTLASETLMVAMKDINVKESTQSRTHAYSDEAVDEYRDGRKKGDVLPEVHLYTWSDRENDPANGFLFYVGDGFNRIEALTRDKVKEVQAIVHTVEGNRMDAQKVAAWKSATSNFNHGLRRTAADKRKAVRIAITQQPHLNDARISELTRVDAKTVKRERYAMQGLDDPYPDTNGTAAGKGKGKGKGAKGGAKTTVFTPERIEEMKESGVLTYVQDTLLDLDRLHAALTPELEPVLSALIDFLDSCGIAGKDDPEEEEDKE